jgi:hypothetical protein
VYQVEIYRLLVACTALSSTLKMEVVSSSEKSVNSECTLFKSKKNIKYRL